MGARRDPLHAAREMRRGQTEAAAQQLTERQRALDEASQALDRAQTALATHRASDHDRAQRERGHDPLPKTGAEMARMRAFSSRRETEHAKLARDVERARDQREHARRELEAARRTLAEARAAERALEQHELRRHRRHRREAERAAEIEADDRHGGRSREP